MPKVKFMIEVDNKKEKSLVKLAKKANIKIKLPCDGKGKCGKCLVKVSGGKVSPPDKSEVKKLGEEKLIKGYRMACQVDILDDDVTVEVID